MVYRKKATPTNSSSRNLKEKGRVVIGKNIPLNWGDRSTMNKNSTVKLFDLASFFCGEIFSKQEIAPIESGIGNLKDLGNRGRKDQLKGYLKQDCCSVLFET